MAILTISRDWGVDPSIVRVTSDDDYDTITTTGYVASQQSNIYALQNGVFEWVPGDMVAISYDGGDNIFTYNATTGTFVIASPSVTFPITVSEGGTGNTSATPYAPIIGGTDSTANFLQADDSGFSTSGYVLTSNGDAAAPTWQAGGSPTYPISIGDGGTGLSGFGGESFHLLATGSSTVYLIDNPGTAGNVLTSNGVNAYPTWQGPVAAGPYFSVTVVLTAVQFQGMYATPVLILTTPPTNFAWRVVSVTYASVLGSSITGGGDVFLQYGNTAHGAGTHCSTALAATTLQAQDDDYYYYADGVIDGVLQSVAARKGIYISNITGAYTVGPSEFNVNLVYQKVDCYD